MSAEMFVLRLLRFLLPQPVVCKVEAIRFFFAFHSILYSALLVREVCFLFNLMIAPEVENGHLRHENK